MIDYLEQLLTQVVQIEDQEHEHTPLLSTSASLSPSLLTAVLSPFEKLSVEQEGEPSSQGDNPVTASLLSWMANFSTSEKQIGLFQGQGKGKSLAQDGQPTGGISPSGQNSNETKGGALSLYRQLVDAQWQASGLVGGANISATPSFSTAGPLPSVAAPPIMTTPSTPLSSMTPQSFDTLVARDARRYDGGFIRY